MFIKSMLKVDEIVRAEITGIARKYDPNSTSEIFSGNIVNPLNMIDSLSSCRITNEESPHYKFYITNPDYFKFLKCIGSIFRINSLFKKNIMRDISIHTLETEQCKANSDEPLYFSFELPDCLNSIEINSPLIYLSDIFSVLTACAYKNLGNLKIFSLRHSINLTGYKIYSDRRFIFVGRLIHINQETRTVIGDILTDSGKLICSVSQDLLIYKKIN